MQKTRTEQNRNWSNQFLNILNIRSISDKNMKSKNCSFQFNWRNPYLPPRRPAEPPVDLCLPPAPPQRIRLGGKISTSIIAGRAITSQHLICRVAEVDAALYHARLMTALAVKHGNAYDAMEWLLLRSCVV